MGKIYCIMGKSYTGKDTLFKKILGDESLSLKTIVPYTTRPVRAGEKNGVEYFFCDEKKVEELEREGRIIELRAYDTIHGIWNIRIIRSGGRGGRGGGGGGALEKRKSCRFI